VLPCVQRSNRYATWLLARGVLSSGRMSRRIRSHHPAAFDEPTARALLLGAGAGAAATIAMSGLMLAAQRLGLLGRSPPRHIVDRALGCLHVRDKVSRQNRQLLTALAHLGFGATQGALYAVLYQVLARYSPRPIAPSTATGVPFALCVWAASYAGWIPALGILPSPSHDRPGRPTSMVLAHVVYGAALANILRKVRLLPS
jgi:hypothetical protein